MGVIRLVQRDTLPQVRVTITDNSSDIDSPVVIPITGASVRMHFRRTGTVGAIASLVGIVTNGPAGQCVFDWGPDTLNVEDGTYEGEVEVTFPGGGRQTVINFLQFHIRKEIA